jgi:DinB superfamily
MGRWVKSFMPRPRRTLPLLAAGLLALSPLARPQPPELGLGWLPEFNGAARQLLALAEATPADQFGWRPGPGVRSVSEVYMHIAAGNLWLLGQAGAKLPPTRRPRQKSSNGSSFRKDAVRDSKTLPRSLFSCESWCTTKSTWANRWLMRE